MEGDPVPAVVAGAVGSVSAETWAGRLVGVTVLAGAVTAVGAILAPTSAGAALLVASQYVLGIGLGGLAFVVFAYLTRAGWSVAIRRVPEVLAATIPLGAVLTLLALAFLPWLYEWSHADVVHGDPILEGKSGWLNPPFFYVRAVVYLLVWLAFSRAILKNSRLQDLDGDVRRNARGTVLSAAFLAAFAVTFSLATFDWLMSLEPHWFSTVYAVYNFSGMFTSALGAILIVAIVLRRLGPLDGILRADHVHDLAKLLFGFATFWGYIWFCQYMLIWYANIPEETVYYSLRQNGAWSVLTLLNVIVNWLIPFLVLLPRPAKRSESIVVKVAVIVLLGRWLDLYLMVAPAHAPNGPHVTLWDLSAMAFALGLFGVFGLRILAKTRLVPEKDPMLGESLHYHL